MMKGIDSDNILNFDKEIECSVDVLLKIDQMHRKKKLLELGELVFLQVCIFKIPKMDEMVNRRIVMKHPIHGDEPEVCLIVSDYIKWDGLKRTSDEMIDLTIEKYAELLNKHEIKGISKIMPFRQLRTEYNVYEMRRKLVNQFDIFLCHNRLFNKNVIYNFLGKIFKAKNKFPITVKLPRFKEDFNQNANKYIQDAISSTTFYIKPSSDNYTIRVGNTLHKKEKLVENLKIVVDKLLSDKAIIPGGFENIRLLGIKTERSKIVPIYICMKSKNNISLPELKLNVKMDKTVEGEISTLPGKKVIVLPTGEVYVRKLRKRSDNESNSDFEDGDNDNHYHEKNHDVSKDESPTGEDRKSKSSNKNIKEERQIADSEEEDEDDDMDEDAVELAEQKYLKNLNYSEISEDEQKEGNNLNKGRKRKGESKIQKVKKPKTVKAKEFKGKKLKKKGKLRQ